MGTRVQELDLDSKAECSEWEEKKKKNNLSLVRNVTLALWLEFLDSSLEPPKKLQSCSEISYFIG